MHLPHLRSFSKQPLLFITAGTADRRALLANNGAKEILERIWIKAATHDGWCVGHYLLMPDHVHFFARSAADATPLSFWMKSWKSISSRHLIASTKISAPVWQADYFDHFIRSAASYAEKWNYVRQNPVRKDFA